MARSKTTLKPRMADPPRRSERLSNLIKLQCIQLDPKHKFKARKKPNKEDPTVIEEDHAANFCMDISNATDRRARAQVYAKFRDLVIREVASRGSWTRREFTQFLHLLDRLGANKDFCSHILKIVYDKADTVKKLALVPLSDVEHWDIENRFGVKVKVTEALTLLRKLKSKNLPGKGSRRRTYYEKMKSRLIAIDSLLYKSFESNSSSSEQTSVFLVDLCFNTLFNALHQENHFCIHKELGLSTLNRDSVPVEIRNTILESTESGGRQIHYYTFLTGSVDHSIIIPTPPLFLPDQDSSILARLKNLIMKLRHSLTITCKKESKSSYEEFSAALDNMCNGISEIISRIKVKDLKPRDESNERNNYYADHYDICLVECKRTETHSHDAYQQSFTEPEVIDNIVKEIVEWQPLAKLDFPDTGFIIDPDPLTTDKAKDIFNKLSKETKEESSPTHSGPQTKKQAKAKFLTDHLGQVIGQCLALHAKSGKEEGVYKFILTTAIHWTWGIVICTPDGQRICKHTKVISVPFKLTVQPNSNNEDIDINAIAEELGFLSFDNETLRSNPEPQDLQNSTTFSDEEVVEDDSEAVDGMVAMEEEDRSDCDDDGDKHDELGETDIDNEESEDEYFSDDEAEDRAEDNAIDSQRRLRYLRHLMFFNIAWLTISAPDLDAHFFQDNVDKDSDDKVEGILSQQSTLGSFQ